MGVLDIFKRKQKEIDLPPPPPPELLEQQDMPQGDLTLPPLPDLPPIENTEVPEPKSYEIPSLENEEFPLPPLEVMPKQELQVKTDEPKQIPVPETIPKKDVPVFVKIDEYRNILENINTIRNKIKESDYVVEALGDLRTKVEAEFEKWREDLEEMQRKLLYIDKVVFEDKVKS
ncbi:hypothetical protein HYV81_00390 [Candidatus Woesearchaeota archaeon]|nr:hypothetical protein [Candidatus Woesearchaeota archaeon]